MHPPLKILLLEDDSDDADLIKLQIKHGGIDFTSIVVDSKEGFVDGLNNFHPDVILSDHSLPKFNSAEALKIFKQHSKANNFHAPFILITGTVSEEFAVQCIKDGAADYILKDRLQRLPSAIISALDKCNNENENERKTAENLLFLERYEYVTKATFKAIWDWDLITNVVYCGTGFLTIFGHKNLADSFLRNLNTAYISVADIERVLTSIQNSIDNGDDNWNCEYQYLKANGDYAFVSDNAIILRNNEGRAIRMIGAMVDITTKKNEDLRLQFLESVITNTSDAIVITEVEFSPYISLKIIYVNDAFHKITGFTNEEAIGKTHRILQGVKTNIDDLKRFQKSVEQNKPCQGEFLSYKKNGDEFWLHISASPIADAKGTFGYWVFIERDITDQKKRVTAMETQNVQLKEIAWLQSHVVRAPLSTMMGFINLIINNNEVKKDVPELLQYVLNSAKEIDEIIRKIVKKSEKINTL